MKLKLLRGLSDQQKVDVRMAWKSDEGRVLLARLREVLRRDYEESIKEMGKKDNYFMPAWSEYQASRLGEQEALLSVINLLSDED